MTLSDLVTIPLEDAHFCESCRVLHNSPTACPNCANGNHSLALAPVLDRKKPPAGDARKDCVVHWKRSWRP